MDLEFLNISDAPPPPPTAAYSHAVRAGQPRGAARWAGRFQ